MRTLAALLLALSLPLRAGAQVPFINGPGSTLSQAARHKIAGAPAMPYGLQLMARFDLLPYYRATKCVQDSSYDRSGGNGDAGHFFRREGDRAVLADIRGPGCIYRFWSANAAGHLRIYFDEEKQPRIDCPMQDLFLGKYAPFVNPIVGHRSGGWYCFFPMPFQRACRVEVTNPGTLYYHVEYQLFPDHTPVRTFTRQLTHADQAALTAVLAQWGHLGDDPKPAVGDTVTLAGGATCQPGATATVTELNGPAQITALHMAVQPANRYALRQTVLRIYWDGDPRPAVEAPIGDFFGSGFGDQRFKALPLAMTDQGYACYWPMPFPKSARIEIANPVNDHSVSVAWQLTYQTFPRPHLDEGYFHAQWHRQTTVAGEHFHILQATGRGHYVGEHTDMQGDRGIWFLEGDEKIYVDGETFPSIYGTGTEDFYTGGWYFDEGPFALAYHGCVVKNDEESRVGAYRFQIQDCVPFQRDIRVDIEHGGTNDYPGADYSCVAYWYQDAPEHAWSPVDVAQLTPPHFGLPGAVEAESLTWSGGTATVQDDRDLLQEASGGKVAVLTGGRLTADVTAPADDVYAITFGAAATPDGAPNATFELPAGGAPVTWDAQANKPATTAVRLRQGANPLAVQIPAGQKLALDYVRLSPSPKREGVIEAESLLSAAVAKGGAVERVDRANSTLSGWSGLQWSPQSTGATLTLPLSIPAEADYALDLGLLRAPGTPGVDVAFDGAPIGHVSTDAATPGAEPAVLPAGRIRGAHSGAHQITLTATAGGAPILIDFLRLRRSLYANVIEAEDLPILDAKEGDATHQALAPEHWSGGEQLFFLGQKAGAEVTLGLDVPVAGDYDLSAYYTTARDYAIVQALIDGHPVGPPVDCYTPDVLAKGRTALGRVTLTAGQHRLTFRAAGKNRDSINYFIGVDAVELGPVR